MYSKQYIFKVHNLMITLTHIKHKYHTHAHNWKHNEHIHHSSSFLVPFCNIPSYPPFPASPLCLCRAPRFDSSSLRPLLCPFRARFWVFQGLVLFLGYELLEGDKPTNSSHLLSFHSVPDNISVCCIHFICKWVLMLSNEGNKT